MVSPSGFVVLYFCTSIRRRHPGTICTHSPCSHRYNLHYWGFFVSKYIQQDNLCNCAFSAFLYSLKLPVARYAFRHHEKFLLWRPSGLYAVFDRHGERKKTGSPGLIASSPRSGVRPERPIFCSETGHWSYSHPQMKIKWRCDGGLKTHFVDFDFIFSSVIV